jgi:hypothetical protein
VPPPWRLAAVIRARRSDHTGRGVHLIDCPPEAVFGFLSPLSNDPVWTASVTESEWLDPTAPMGWAAAAR